MLLKTVSYNLLPFNRSLLSPLGIVKSNFGHCNLLNLEQFKYPQYRLGVHLPTNFSNSCQSTLRTIYSHSSVFQNEIQKPIDISNETETLPSETQWSFSLKSKVFEEKESSFYHQVLERSSAFSGTLYKHDPKFSETYKLNETLYESIVNRQTNWHEQSPSTIYKSFISLGVYTSNNQNITIEDERFQHLISAFVENLKLSNDEQLIDCFIGLKYWRVLNSHQDPHALKVWKALDDICFKRMHDWTIDKCLFMMDLWYHLGLLKRSYFVGGALKKISRKIDEFTAAQMIQSLFYMSVKRNISKNIAIREYEHYIQQYITKLSIEEIGIFASAFFKTKTSILNKKVLMYLMQRTVEEVETIDGMVLSTIAKAVRLSHKPDIGFTANDMVNKVMEARWDSLPFTASIHLVHIGTQVHFYNEEALTKLGEKFCENPSVARLKEMERMMFFLSLFNFIPPTTPDICHLVVEQLNLPPREKEAIEFPLMFLSLLHYLSLLRTFPEKQIRQALDKNKLLEHYGHKFNIPQQAMQLDYNRVLEGPAGCEHILPSDLREYVARRYSMFIPDNTHPIKSEFDKQMYQVMGMTDELLGKENNFATYTIPSFPRADILFRLDESGNPLPIPEEMKKSPQFEDVHRPIGPGKWFCVVIGGRNMYMHNVPRLVGEQAAKLRQLQALGYTPVLIPSYYWKKEENKMEYLRLKYFGSHKSNK